MRKPVTDLTLPHRLLQGAARVLSLCSLAFLFLFLVGESGSDTGPWGLTQAELLLFIFFPVGVMVSLLLAWRWEQTGGSLVILSILAFYVVHQIQTGQWPGGPWFLILASPGPLFLLSGLLAGRQSQRE